MAVTGLVELVLERRVIIVVVVLGLLVFDTFYNWYDLTQVLVLIAFGLSAHFLHAGYMLQKKADREGGEKTEKSDRYKKIKVPKMKRSKKMDKRSFVYRRMALVAFLGDLIEKTK